MCVLYGYTNRQGWYPLRSQCQLKKPFKEPRLIWRSYLKERKRTISSTVMYHWFALQANNIFTKKPTEIWLSVTRPEASQTWTKSHGNQAFPVRRVPESFLREEIPDHPLENSHWGEAIRLWYLRQAILTVRYPGYSHGHPQDSVQYRIICWTCV